MFLVYFSSSFFFLVHVLCINVFSFSNTCLLFLCQLLSSTSLDVLNYYHYFHIMHYNLYCILLDAYILLLLLLLLLLRPPPLLLLLFICTLYVLGGIASMHSILLKFTLVSNSALPFWKLLVSEFLFSISETLLCSMSAPHLKIVPLLDVHQLLMLSARTLTYLEPETFSIIVFILLFYYY
jgi:hypothetical protein